MTERVRRRGPGWVRLDQGVHRRADAADVRRAELSAWLDALPTTAVLTGLTAAGWWGLWLPPLPADLPVFVAVPFGGAHSIRAGVRVHRQRGELAHMTRAGLFVSPVPETLLACAREVGLLDLVVLVDSALHLGLCTVAEIERVAAGRRRGSLLLRTALVWCDTRSESAWETLLRMLHRACDVTVEPQAVLRDAAGAFVAQVDLLIVGTRTIQEYDGTDHLERRRYRRDRRRDSRLSGGGYIRHGWIAPEVLGQGTAILREADRALGRPHDPSRIRAWHELIRGSLFSAAGTAAFCERLGIAVPDAA